MCLVTRVDGDGGEVKVGGVGEAREPLFARGNFTDPKEKMSALRFEMRHR